MFIRLFNKDVIDFLSSIDDSSVDLIYTDPPYGAKLTDEMFGFLLPNYPKNYDEANILFKKYIVELERILKPNSDCYILMNYENYPVWFNYTVQLCKELVPKNCIIWYRSKSGMKIQSTIMKDGKPYWANYNNSYVFIMYLKKGDRILNFDKSPDENFIEHLFFNDAFIERMKGNGGYEHGRKIKYVYPMRVPEEVITPFILNSTNEGDVVLDPFMGSGSVAKVCYNLKRSFIGNDLNPLGYNLIKEWFDVIRK